MTDVFISYSSHDIYVAKALYAKFEAHGISCWMDKSELRGGADWQANITAGIKSSKVFVLVYSAYAVESKWVLRELTLADDNQLFVVPYNIDNSDLDSKFELILSRLQWINAEPRHGRFNYEELLGVTESHLSGKQKMVGLIENKESIKHAKNKRLWLIPCAAVVVIAVLVGYGLLNNSGKLPEDTANIVSDQTNVNNAAISTNSADKSGEMSASDTTVSEESTVSSSMHESDTSSMSAPSETEFDERFNALNTEPESQSVEAENLAPGRYTIGDFDIYVKDDGTAELSGCKSSDFNIVVPEKINGAVITSTSYSSFSKCPNAVEITLPDTVTIIKQDTFSGMSKLVKVNLGNGVQTIENSAFNDCKNLQEIELPDTVTSLGAAFNQCKNLKKIKLSNNIEVLERYTFDDCISLESIIIPDSVKNIKSGAFRNCSGLKSVTFGSGLTDIETSAFEGCSSITDVTIPGNVLFVEANAFSQCYSIESATFEEGVISIGAGALGGCESLKTVSFPDSLSDLSDGFYYSTNPAKKIPDDIQITYKGNVYGKEMISQLIKDVNG